MPQSRSERIAGVFIYIILSFITLLVLYPLFFVLIASISAPETVMRGKYGYGRRNCRLSVTNDYLPIRISCGDS